MEKQINKHDIPANHNTHPPHWNSVCFEPEEYDKMVDAIITKAEALATAINLTKVYYDAHGLYYSPSTRSRELSENIERALIETGIFAKGEGHNDLSYTNPGYNGLPQRWEVKVSKESGKFTVNASAQFDYEHYIITNYDDQLRISKIWMLCHAEDKFFEPRQEHLNMRKFIPEKAEDSIVKLYPTKEWGQQELV